MENERVAYGLERNRHQVRRRRVAEYDRGGLSGRRVEKGEDGFKEIGVRMVR